MADATIQSAARPVPYIAIHSLRCTFDAARCGSRRLHIAAPDIRNDDDGPAPSDCAMRQSTLPAPQNHPLDSVSRRGAPVRLLASATMSDVNVDGCKRAGRQYVTR